MRPINPTLGSEPLRASRISSINTIAKSWDSVLFQQGKSILDFDLNVQQRIVKEQMSELSRMFVDSGFSKAGTLSYSAGKLQIPITRANIFGTYFHVADYNETSGITTASYSVNLSDSTSASAVFVWLEMWFEEIIPENISENIDGSSSAVSQKKETIVHAYGNKDSVNILQNEIRDPVFGAETTRRIQICWRFRSVAEQNPSVYNKGFGNVSASNVVESHNADLLARGGKNSEYANGVTGKTFLRGDESNFDYNYQFTSEPDTHFWVAGTGTAADALALNTVDGRVYALPVCYIYDSSNPTIIDIRDIIKSVVPVLGVAFGTNSPSGFTITSGESVPKTLTVNNGLNLSATDTSEQVNVNFGTGGTVAYVGSSLGNANAGNLTATTVNGLNLTSNSTGFSIGGGTTSKTISISNSLNFSGTDSASINFGSGGTVAYIGNKLNAFAATSSSELASVISDETGTGALVFATSPSLVTPNLGVASATSINKLQITAPSTAATLAIANNKTFTVNNTLTLSGTDGISVAFGTVGGTVAYVGGSLGNANVGALTATTVNGLTLASLSEQGFTIAGGSTSKTLEIDSNIRFAVSSNESISNIITFPNGSGTVVDTSTTQSLTNKTFIDGSTFFQDDTTSTKKMKFELSQVTAGQTRTITVPDKNGTIALVADMITVGKVIALAMVFG